MTNSPEQRQLIKGSRAFKWSEPVYPLVVTETITTDELKRHAKAMHVQVLKRGNPFAMTIYDCYVHLHIRNEEKVK